MSLNDKTTVAKQIELLAPGGDIDSIKAAIIAGANAVYCGLNKFNARNSAANICIADLNGILRFAHKNNCQVFLTLNIIIVDSEIPSLIDVLNKLVNTSIDGIIVQDFGLFFILSKYFERLCIHASTQLTTHNEGQVLFLGEINATRVNLSRELSIDEIKHLTLVAHNHTILIEVFVHGSNCISFSGLCYMSSVNGGNSGNRGRCSQPCRDQYMTTPEGKNFPLNIKDNSAYSDLIDLSNAGVDSLKIEGRIKKAHYVYTVVDAWRKQLIRFYNENKINDDKQELYKVFNRDFTNDYLKGTINKKMFIDNPRDNSAIHLSEIKNSSCFDTIDKAKAEISVERNDLIAAIENKISQVSLLKAPILISISGECGKPLKVTVSTPDNSFVLFSEMNLSSSGKEMLNYEIIFNRLKAVNDTEYFIENMELDQLQQNLYLSFKELTGIKKRLLFILNGEREFIATIDVPVLPKHNSINSKPSIAILISSPNDLYLCNSTSATIYYQLPNCLKNESAKLIDLFKNNKRIIPWFPSVLIGNDYTAGVNFLKQVLPTSIVTNNTGIAYEAYKAGINWIAGPNLNSVNSYSLICLKEKFNCSGAFISNEISKIQIKNIKKPYGFHLYYSIYHPIELMTSRQCLFQQVTGCEKEIVDDTCIHQCEKYSSITNLKKEISFIVKTKGDYHRVFNEMNFLNIDIVKDIPNLFSEFLIDLRDIHTDTKMGNDKQIILFLFESILNGDSDAEKELRKIVFPTTKSQYENGI